MFILLGRKVVKLFLTISLRLQSTCAYTFHQECIAGNRKFTLEESQDKLLLFYITMLSLHRVPFVLHEMISVLVQEMLE